MEAQEQMSERMSVEGIVADLRHKIFSGEYGPGDKLREVDMCGIYKVSRTPVREAFRLLQNEGVLQYIPRCGVQVAELTLDDLHHSYVIRGVLETLSSKTAAAYMDAAGIARLKEINEMLLHTDDVGEQSEMDNNFHRLIAEYSHNPMLAEFLDTILTRTRIIRYTIPFKKERIPCSYKEHQDIIRAFELKDEELVEKYTQIHFKMSLRSLDKKMSDYLSDHSTGKRRKKKEA